VAGFIGSPKMNFLEGDFVKAFDCTTLGIRSEQIDFCDENPFWQGEVVHTEDVGSDNYIFVEIGSKEPLIVRSPGRKGSEYGRKVGLKPQDQHLHRFNREGSPIR